MKSFLPVVLLVTLSLIGCGTLNRALTSEDVVGTWQCKKDQGIAQTVQTLQFMEDGTFSFRNTDNLAKSEMKGHWSLHDNRIRLSIQDVKIGDEPNTTPEGLARAFLSQPITRYGYKLAFRIGDGDEFVRVSKDMPEK